MKFLPVFFTSLALLGASADALAVNVRFLNESVLAKFSKEEAKDFRQAIGVALDTLKDQQTILWESQTSSLKGKFKPIFTYTAEGITCRRSLFLIGTDNNKQNFHFEICKADGKWAIQDTPVLHFNNGDWQRLEASATQALLHSQVGQPLSWFNPDSKNYGVNVVTAIYRLNGQDCRDLAISIMSHRGKSSSGNYSFCHSEQGWTRHINQH